MISKKLEKALNGQINKELTAAYNYMALAAWFETQSLDGFAHWMQKQAGEEVEHAMKLYAHVNERGGTVAFEAIDKPTAKADSVHEAFKASKKMEEANTKAINELYALALAENDYPAQIMLQWFIDEQVEEESTMQTILDQLEMAGESGGAILYLNSHLGKRE